MATANIDQEMEPALNQNEELLGITPSRRSPHGGVSRKRKADRSSWKQSVRKIQRQSGKAYKNTKGEQMPKRSIVALKSCRNCKFKCSTNISEIERQIIFDNFWTLDDDGKKHFYSKTTENLEKKRCRTAAGDNSRRKTSYYYSIFVSNTQYRVCKSYYLSTLNISSHRVFYFHKFNKSLTTGTPLQSKSGKYVKKRLLEESKQVVRDHINLFPRIDAHYSRRKTHKEYMEGSLNIGRMYDLYKIYCDENVSPPAKEHMYRYIFNHEFNIVFQKPKKDLCDTCYEYRNIVNASNKQTDSYNKHIKSRNDTKTERENDRQNVDSKTAIVCIDLENVLNLPRANVGNFYYKRKLSNYNLTGHCSLNRKGYCILWHEAMTGRGGNDLASAVTCLLLKIMADLDINKFILWFDSCVPQNRNSFISAALCEFIIRYPQIKVIEQKFCEPGHSSIQEWDNIHSQIEKSLSAAEIFSPLGLERAIKNVIRKKPFCVYQMQLGDVKNFSVVAGLSSYKLVPYSKVKNLVYRNGLPYHVFFKTSFSDNYSQARINKSVKKAASTIVAKPLNTNIPMAACFRASYQSISVAKANDIISMYSYMPAVDIAFYKTIIN
ncbi:uncharacterized protein LOC124817910 [Hydra vulgaris]|uniref:uncharacterized protein LOC124817910 n=1 Tax=Hydra vulgaris TaxID=6087 RepID=UPI00019257D1|nr:uncharacterized protein LOC124817910 [Hydra vulgaris]